MSDTKTDTVTGGCRCGAVRFKVPAEPAVQLLCHCPDCKHISGGPAYAAYVVPLDEFELTAGEVTAYDVIAQSGQTNSRRFCPICGSRVYAEIHSMGMASVNGMALDNGEHFNPGTHYFVDTAPSWCALNSALVSMPSG